MRPTIVAVLPVPAEAIIRLCPLDAVAASACWALSWESGIREQLSIERL